VNSTLLPHSLFYSLDLTYLHYVDLYLLPYLLMSPYISHTLDESETVYLNFYSMYLFLIFSALKDFFYCEDHYFILVVINYLHSFLFDSFMVDI